MLYLFNVDAGTMMTFDISLCMETVAVLQEHIAEEHKIPVDMQVLLVSGGIALLPNDRVCSFSSAGTDTNPIFLYNKKYYNDPCSEIPPELHPCDAAPEHPIMKSEVDVNLVLPVAINSVIVRSQLAQRFFEMDLEDLECCQRMIHEQHLQHQGYAAAIANMDDTIPAAKASVEQFVSFFKEYLNNKERYSQLSESVVDVASTLSSIPLLPSLVDLAIQDPLANVSSCEELVQRKNVSLLDWLHLRNSSDSFRKLSEMCSRGIQQHDEQIASSVQALLDHAIVRSQDEVMRNIKGLSDRFSQLELLLHELRSIVQEQGDFAKALQQNAENASRMGDTSILHDLCTSHRRHLVLMEKNHVKVMDIRRRISACKAELIKSIYMRMKWVYGVESDIAIVFERTLVYMNSLKSLKEQINILQQAHTLPHLYLTAVTEVVRRRTFSTAFLMWANDLVCQLCAVHSEEVVRRQNFQGQFDGHMLNALFPGLEDIPPPFATQAPESFDTKLPKLTIEDIETLKEKVANFTLSVSVPDLNAITNFFTSKSITNPIKPKEVERLVEEVTAMEQPSESTAGAVGFLASVLPITDRGFESETDTEEFEKVGQSPTEMVFEKKTDNVEQQKSVQLSRAKEEMEKSIVTMRNDLSSLREWLKSEHSHVHSFLEQLSSAYHNDVVQKSQLIHQLRQELSVRETEVNELSALTDELQKRLSLSMESESRERDLKEQAEAIKERAVKEATEQLTQDHRSEMEAVRCRFRLMASTSMEHSPSELSSSAQSDKGSLEMMEEVMAQVRAELSQEKERAIAEERQHWQNKLDHQMHQLKIRADADKQIWFNEAMRRVLVEKDRQLENLRVHSVHMESECKKHLETIHRFAGTSVSIASESSLLERVEALEAAKEKLEAELAEARSSPLLHHGTPMQQDMSTSSTSSAFCDGSLTLDCSSRDAATSPDPVRKTQLKEKLTKSTTSLIQQGKVSVGSCNIGETVLVVWEDSYENYMILQESSTLYFLHPDSLAAMSLFLSSDATPRRVYRLAEVVEKEYCHARKSVNRYNVAKGTKFFRVKVKPMAILPHHSQSSSGCSA